MNCSALTVHLREVARGSRRRARGADAGSHGHDPLADTRRASATQGEEPHRAERAKRAERVRIMGAAAPRRAAGRPSPRRPAIVPYSGIIFRARSACDRTIASRAWNSASSALTLSTHLPISERSTRSGGPWASCLAAPPAMNTRPPGTVCFFLPRPMVRSGSVVSSGAEISRSRVRRSHFWRAVSGSVGGAGSSMPAGRRAPMGPRGC